MPLLSGCAVVLSCTDSMGRFSSVAAVPRHRVLALHLTAAVTVAVLLSCLALRLSGAADAVPLSVRNLLGFTGTAALCAAVLGFRSAWILPLIQAVAAFMVGSPGAGGVDAQWWEWPRAASTDGGSWAVCVALAAVGVGALLLRNRRTGMS